MIVDINSIKYTKEALFKKESYIDKIINNYLILGTINKYKTSSGVNRTIWLVQCIHCSTYISILKNSVIEPKRTSTSGCASCHKGRRREGSTRYNWKGGEFIPGKYLSEIKNRLVRKTRTLDFDEEIDIQFLENLFIKQGGKCAYSGRTLVFGNRYTEGTASVDRIDSSKGYLVDNIQFVHKNVNKFKADLPEGEFLTLCEEIYLHRKKSNE